MLEKRVFQIKSKEDARYLAGEIKCYDKCFRCRELNPVDFTSSFK